MVTPSPKSRLSETQIQKKVLAYAEQHVKIAWVERINSGAFKTTRGRWMFFGFKGCSDIIGQLIDGRFLAVEVKRPGEEPTDDQYKFLDKVVLNGGCSVIATCPEDVRDTILEIYPHG